MATLRKAQDGHYFALHRYQDVHKWQVAADAVVARLGGPPVRRFDTETLQESAQAAPRSLASSLMASPLAQSWSFRSRCDS